MCGIAGYQGNLQQPEKMLQKIDSRGGHAFGYTWKAQNEKFQIKKYLGPVPHNFKIKAKSDLMLMHTRFATHGNPKNMNNNHPFETKEWILVHNGVVQNTHKSQKTQCDSEAILKMLMSQEGDTPLERVKKTAEQINGSFRLGIIYKPTQALYVVSDDNDPVFFIITNTVVAFASEEWQLPEIKGVKFRACGNSIYQIRKNKEMKMVNFKKKEREFNIDWRNYSVPKEDLFFNKDTIYCDDEEREQALCLCEDINELNFVIDEICDDCNKKIKECKTCEILQLYSDIQEEMTEEEKLEEMSILQKQKENIY